MKLNFFLVFTLSFTITGCVSLTDIRGMSPSEEKKINQIRKERSLLIKEGDTFYSNSLRCVDRKFDEINTRTHPETGKKIKLDITSARIFDKTGALLKNSNSTALSDMVLHALTKMPLYFEVVDTPLSEEINDSRINYSSSQNPFRKTLIDSAKKNGTKIAFNVESIENTPVGVTHPTASYINGAIVQYDETSELPKDSRSLGLNIDPVNLSQDVQVTTVGINLRLINAPTGRIADNGSIYLTNRLVGIRKTSEIFKVISGDAHDFDYSVVTADPKHYAVMEMLEKGIYTIFSRLIGSPKECRPENTNTANGE